jgi:hypothetical protein
MDFVRTGTCFVFVEVSVTKRSTMQCNTKLIDNP